MKMHPVATADFRSVGPIDWLSLKKLKLPAPVAVIQTPRCNCEVRMVGIQMYRLIMKFHDKVKLHAEFLEFLHRLDEGALEASRNPETELREAVEGCEYRACTFRRYNSDVTELTVTAFCNTPMYDSKTNKLSSKIADPPAASACCQLKVDGVWRANGKWGVRLGVVCVKFSSEPVGLCFEVTDDDEDDNDNEVMLLTDD